ncbi:hypothetical protein M407DRAFT_241621 [Tulasnella calospora MUT 4182]|uniref:Hemerythrin-like domain-containing protein n=1 Tax=Tulasnella calospora MUT 4182 TaxID=1051891 RepID=A0A0C3LD78_9AGAM|nr:hypothetical protein M407DRAFT_241621 [Tulasnella calospora MUT 4182]
MNRAKLARVLSASVRAPSRFTPISSQFLYRTMSRSAVGSTISEEITQDHRELEEYYGNYRTATSEKEKTQWANQFCWELARHSVGEELVLYPAFEKHLGPEGKQIADTDRAEHLEAKKLLYELEGTHVNDPNFPTILKKLMEELREHMKSEEENDLVKFEAAISREESEAMAKSFQRAKKFAPTHSHPNAPDKGGLFQTAAGLAAAPIDKLRDMFLSFPEQEKM